MSQIDAGTTANAMVTLGATAFLGTNDFYDDDLVSLSIEGGGSFFDGATSREFRLGSWNDWVRHSFPVRGITSETKFVFASRTASKGRVFLNFFNVVKLADDYDPAAGTQPLETPQKPAVAAATAYGADLSWPAVTTMPWYVPTGGLWPRARRGNPAFISEDLPARRSEDTAITMSVSVPITAITMLRRTRLRRYPLRSGLRRCSSHWRLRRQKSISRTISPGYRPTAAVRC